MSIIITGASGYIGRHTVRFLIERGVKPSELILVTRNPASLSAMASQGASVRQGDFADPAGLPAAFAGGDRMFLISAAPDNLPEGLDQPTAHTAAIEAAKQAGVRHVVLQSSIEADENSPSRDDEDYQTEQALLASGMAWTMLRTSPFADSRGRECKRFLSVGGIDTNLGDTAAYTVVREDIAEAAAAVLAGSGHENKIYNLLGQGVTMDQLGQTLTELGGRQVAVRRHDDESFITALIAQGRTPRSASWHARSGKSQRENPVRVACDIPRLIGRAGRSLLDLLRANREELITGQPPAGREAMFL